MAVIVNHPEFNKDTEEDGNATYYYVITPGEYKLDFEIHDDEYHKPIIEGYLKWDHCMNWRTDGFYHFCEPEHVLILSKLLQHVWTFGEEHIGRWDRS